MREESKLRYSGIEQSIKTHFKPRVKNTVNHCPKYSQDSIISFLDNTSLGNNNSNLPKEYIFFFVKIKHDVFF